MLKGTKNMKFNITADKAIINFPVKDGATTRLMRVSVDGRVDRSFCVELAEGEPDYWCFLDASNWAGETVTLEVADGGPTPGVSLDGEARGLAGCHQAARRPQFHFTSRRGWLNDPNGLVYHQGEYHLFYQHNPFGVKFDNQHWGHAVSPDLVHWRELPSALTPDSFGAVWSGSAVVDWHNSSGFQSGDEPPLVALYTASGTPLLSPGAPCVQCLAFSNDRGRSWSKYSGNPVIPPLRPGNRDPKVVWHEGRGRWIMVLYLADDEYAFLASPDLKRWTPLHTIHLPGCSECPDFFEMAVEGSQERKWVFTAANGTYLVGDFDGERFAPTQAPVPTRGNGNYAVQTFSDAPDGRRIQIAWMTRGQVPPFNLDFLHEEFRGCPFKGNLSFPCELTLHREPRGLRLHHAPAKEIDSLAESVSLDRMLRLSSAELPLKDPGGPLRLAAVFDVTTAVEFGLELRGVRIGYDTRSGLLSVSGSGADIPVELISNRLRLDILMDTCSLECFINDGVEYLPLSILSRDMGIPGIKAFASAGVATLSSHRVVSLKSAWDNRMDK